MLHDHCENTFNVSAWSDPDFEPNDPKTDPDPTESGSASLVSFAEISSLLRQIFFFPFFEYSTSTSTVYEYEYSTVRVQYSTSTVHEKSPSCLLLYERLCHEIFDITTPIWSLDFSCTVVPISCIYSTIKPILQYMELRGAKNNFSHF